MSEEEGNLITDKMVKKATFLIHKLAQRRGADYSEIQKKCKKLLGYTNLAKVSLVDGHAIINKLIELTGGEEEEEKPKTDATDDLSVPAKPDENTGATVIDDGTTAKEIVEPKKEEKEQDDDLVTSTMRKAIRAAVDITQKEVIEKEIPVMGLGGFVLEVGKVLFEAKMREEAD